MSNIKKSILALFLLCFCACKNPTDNIKIVINTNIIKYSVLIHISDAANATTPPPGIVMTISGQDDANIYEISGKKNFTVADGIITVGVGPGVTPTTSNPVKFNVNVSAPGYTAVTQAVQINAGQMQQVVSIVMVKVNTVAPIVPIVQPIINPPPVVPVTLNFIGTCVNKPNFELLPSIYVFYRVTGSNTGFQYLGYMDTGLITANLTMGITYDFEITYGGVNYSVSQKIDQTTFTERIDLGTICNNF